MNSQYDIKPQDAMKLLLNGHDLVSIDEMGEILQWKTNPDGDLSIFTYIDGEWVELLFNIPYFFSCMFAIKNSSK